MSRTGVLVGRHSCGCDGTCVSRRYQSFLRRVTLSLPLLCRWWHFRENGRNDGLRNERGRLRNLVAWSDGHAHLNQGIGFEGNAKCLEVVFYNKFVRAVSADGRHRYHPQGR